MAAAQVRRKPGKRAAATPDLPDRLAASRMKRNRIPARLRATDQDGGPRCPIIRRVDLQTQYSYASGIANKDFVGDIASSKAHLVPDSSCRNSHGVACQAVCGVKFDDQELFKKLADCMVTSDTNFLRSRSPAHGELYDAKPCWIFVPICSLELSRNGRTAKATRLWLLLVLSIRLALRLLMNSLISVYVRILTMILAMIPPVISGGRSAKCEVTDIEEATSRLTDIVLALAETLVGREGKISPTTLQLTSRSAASASAPRAPDEKEKFLQTTTEDLKTRGVMVPQLQGDLASVEVLKFVIDPSATDLVPDLMLLLIKAAINWSSRCGQTLLPACDSVHSEREEEELVVPSTPYRLS